MALSEKQLDQLLDKAFRDDSIFLRWFLSPTRFADRGASYLWSRCDHPWGTIDFVSTDPQTGIESVSKMQGETDILLVVKAADGEHLALHIENKIGSGKFTHMQAEMYSQRATQWRGRPEYKNYTDFVTVLVAPEIFRSRYPEQAALFDSFLSHDAVAERLPGFTARF